MATFTLNLNNSDLDVLKESLLEVATRLGTGTEDGIVRDGNGNKIGSWAIVWEEDDRCTSCGSTNLMYGGSDDDGRPFAVCEDCNTTQAPLKDND